MNEPIGGCPDSLFSCPLHGKTDCQRWAWDARGFWEQTPCVPWVRERGQIVSSARAFPAPMGHKPRPEADDADAAPVSGPSYSGNAS